MDNEANEENQSENPRTRRVCSLILSTCVEVFLEEGAHQVTASNIAQKADVARTTIYRHWPDQRSLLLATVEKLTSPHHIEPATGPLEDDVRSGLQQLHKRLVRRKVQSVFGALAGYAAQDDAFGDAQRLFVEQLTQPMVAVLDAAKERGELTADLDCTFEATLLTGPILHQHLALRGKITNTLIEETIRRWLTSKP